MDIEAIVVSAIRRGSPTTSANGVIPNGKVPALGAGKTAFDSLYPDHQIVAQLVAHRVGDAKVVRSSRINLTKEIL